MATPQSRRVMFRGVGACDQPLRVGAHGFRSHWLDSPLSIRKSRIRLEAAALKIAAAEAGALAQKS